MLSTNISINQRCSVSINVAVLKATLQAIKQRVLSVVAIFSLFTFHFSLSRLYRQELRMARAIARVIDAHPTLSNIALWLMGIGFMFEIFMFV